MLTSVPWQPLLTTLRSGQPEITLYGSLSICHGSTSLLTVGDVRAPLWSRSLLKPWQLLACLPTLETAYPALTPAHIALMMASHNGEPRHITLLHELMALGDIQDRDFQCPACAPMAQAERQRLEDEGKSASPLYHPCSGKHVGQLLTLKAQHQDITHYLSPESPMYQALLSWLNTHFPGEIPALQATIDGCQMANMALTTDLLARLYYELATKTGDVHLTRLQKAMQSHPEVLGGSGRLDTRLIQRTWTGEDGPKIYAKEGADGLLGVGISASPQYPQGIGICLKLASGYNREHLEHVILVVLDQLGLLRNPLPQPIAPLARQAHFEIKRPSEVAS